MVNKIAQLTSISDDLEEEFGIDIPNPIEQNPSDTHNMSLVTNFTLLTHQTGQDHLKTPRKHRPRPPPPMITLEIFSKTTSDKRMMKSK